MRTRIKQDWKKEKALREMKVEDKQKQPIVLLGSRAYNSNSAVIELEELSR